MTVFDQILDINASIKKDFYHKDRININFIKRHKALKNLNQLKEQVKRYSNLDSYSMEEINSFIETVSMNEGTYGHCTRIKAIGMNLIATFEFPIGTGTGVVETNTMNNFIRYIFKNMNGNYSSKSVELKEIYVLDTPPSTTPEISRQLLAVATCFGSIYQEDVSKYLNQKLYNTEQALNDY